MTHDPRIKKQAKILVDYSTKVKAGDVVQIVGSELAKPLILEIYRQVLLKRAKEVVTEVQFDELKEIFFKVCTIKQLKQFPQLKMDLLKKTDVFIAIHAPKNTRSLSNIYPDKFVIRRKVTKPIHDYRVEKTRWVITAFPTDALAQEADMSLSEYSDFLFKTICNVNWEELGKKQQRLKKILDKGKKIKILAKDTEIEMNIQGRKAVCCNGEENMPGGEVFTSVVENGVEGHIHYDFPAIYKGREVEGIKLWFKKGKVVKAVAKKGESWLKKLIKMDRGARFVGELGFGNNYHINRFTKSTLFDEKMGGTIHLALGKGFKETGCKNDSALHWDMIKDLRDGGEIYLDGKLIQKNGRWVV